MNFESAVQQKIEQGLSLRAAISDAAAENPIEHQQWINQQNTDNRSGLSLFSKKQFKTFNEAVRQIADRESVGYGTATKLAAQRFPELHSKFIRDMNPGVECAIDKTPYQTISKPAIQQASDKHVKLSTVKRRQVNISAPIIFNGGE